MLESNKEQDEEKECGGCLGDGGGGGAQRAVL